MPSGRSLFLHTLVFDCPRCGDSVASRSLSTERSREAIDGATVQLHCPCGWTGQQLGLRAKEHSVESWASQHAEAGQ